MVKNLVEYIVKGLVDKPGMVVVSESEIDGKSVVQVRVASHDLAKVIGNEGRVFRALRTVVNSMGFAQPYDIIVDVVE